MSMRWLARSGGWLLLALIIALVLAFRPWTVRSIGWEQAVERGDPTARAAAIWEQSLAGATYKNIARVDDFGPSAALVTGVGRITQVDRASRVGLAYLDLSPPDGLVDVALHVGPIVRGTALRDALGLTFADFDSQMDYARVAEALNERAMDQVAAFVDHDVLEGKVVRFAGATVADEGAPREVVPTRIEIEP